MEFVYKARKKTGEIESGTMEAASRRDVVADLQANGFVPLSVKEKSFNIALPHIPGLLGRISLDQKLTFIKNMAVMIKSGVPITRSLKILSAQTTNARFQKLIAEMAREVEHGTELSKSFAQRPEIFSGLYVSLIEVGEAGGTLEKNLDYLARLLRRQADLVRKTKGALMYPAVVLVTLVIVGILMFIFVLPKLTSTFTDLNVELPALTRFLIFLVDIFSHYSVLIILGLIALVAAAIIFLRSDSGKRYFDGFIIYTPVIAKIVQKINMARFTLVLGSLLKSGMQIVGALQITAKSLQNSYYYEAVKEASEKVKVGVTLSDSLARYPRLFPSLVVQMIKVGEESGTVEEVLREVGDHYEVEVDEVMKNLSSIIEPLLVVVIGAVVGVIAVALIMPIYSITQAI